MGGPIDPKDYPSSFPTTPASTLALASPFRPTPGSSEVISAFFRTENFLTNALMIASLERFQQQPGYIAVLDDDLSAYRDSVRHFRGSGSPEETDSIKQRIDSERADRQTISDSGGLSFAVGLLTSGFLDIDMLAGGLLVKGGRLGARAARGALRGAAVIGGTVAAGEVILQANQIERTGLESAANILFAGAIGAPIGAFINRKAALQSLEEATALTALDELSPGGGTVGAQRAGDMIIGDGLERARRLIDEGMDPERARAIGFQEAINQQMRLRAEDGSVPNGNEFLPAQGFVEQIEKVAGINEGRLQDLSRRVFQPILRFTMRTFRYLNSTSEIRVVQVAGKALDKPTFVRKGSEELVTMGPPREVRYDNVGRKLYGEIDESYKAYEEFRATPEGKVETIYGGKDIRNWDEFREAVGYSVMMGGDGSPPVINRLLGRYLEFQKAIQDDGVAWGALERNPKARGAVHYGNVRHKREVIEELEASKVRGEIEEDVFGRVRRGLLEQGAEPGVVDDLTRAVVARMKGDSLVGQGSLPGSSTASLLSRNLEDVFPLEERIAMGLVDLDYHRMLTNQWKQVQSRVETVKSLAPDQPPRFHGIHDRLTDIENRMASGGADDELAHELAELREDIGNLHASMQFSFEGNPRSVLKQEEIAGALDELDSIRVQGREVEGPPTEVARQAMGLRSRLATLRSEARDLQRANKQSNLDVDPDFEFDPVQVGDMRIGSKVSFDGRPARVVNIGERNVLRDVTRDIEQQRTFVKGLDDVTPSVPEVTKLEEQLASVGEKIERSRGNNKTFQKNVQRRKELIRKITDAKEKGRLLGEKQARLDQLVEKRRSIRKGADNDEVEIAYQGADGEEVRITVSREEVDFNSLEREFESVDALSDVVRREYFDRGSSPELLKKRISQEVGERVEVLKREGDDKGAARLIGKGDFERRRMDGAFQRMHNEPTGDPEKWYNKASGYVMALTYFQKGGGFALASLADAVSTTFAIGMDSQLRSYRAKLQKSNAFNELLPRNVRVMEVVSNQRAMAYGDYAPVEGAGWFARQIRRLQQGGTTKNPAIVGAAKLPVFNKIFRDAGEGVVRTPSYAKATGLNSVTGVNTQIASVAAVDRVLMDMELWVKGGDVPKGSLREFADMGIDRKMAARIVEEWGGLMDDTGLLRMVKTQEWSDPLAVRAFDEIILGQTRRAVFTSTVGDRPFFLDEPLIKMLGQFRSFGIVSAENMVLGSLSKGIEPRTAQGLASALLVGSAVAALRDVGRNVGKGPDALFRDARDAPLSFVRDSIDQSGLVGWFGDLVNIVERATGVGPRMITGGRGAARFQSRNAWGAVLGPATGGANDVSKILYDTLNLGWTQKTTSSIRRITIGQNHVIARPFVDVFKRAFDDFLSIPERAE